MQLYLSLSGDQTILPFSYQSLVHGAIYHALAGDADFAARLHNARPGEAGRAFKGFHFSPLTGPYTVLNGKLLFHETLRLEIRSIDPHFIQALAKAWPVGGSVLLGDQRVRVTACEIRDRHVTEPEIDISMLSPVAVYQTLDTGKTVFFAPDEPRFYEAVTRNAERKWHTFAGEAPFDFSITPLFSGLPKRVFTVFKKTYITGWKGEYRLRGDPAVLDMLYQVGLGVKNSEGFGMFRTVFSAHNKNKPMRGTAIRKSFAKQA